MIIEDIKRNIVRLNVHIIISDEFEYMAVWPIVCAFSEVLAQNPEDFGLKNGYLKLRIDLLKQIKRHMNLFKQFTMTLLSIVLSTPNC